jgi:integrase
MPKKTHMLDDIQIRNWIAKAQPLAKSDGDGLTFTYSKAGTASWVLRYRMGAGRRKELTLGNYPDLSLAAARKAARTHRVAIDNGQDPAADKKTDRARSVAAWTVKDLIADYTEKKLVPALLAEGTIYRRKSDLTKVVTPRIGSMQVRNVTAADIVHMVELSKRSWTISERILTSTSRLFDHACGKRMIDANPCVGISLESIMGARPAIKKRVMLTAKELHAVLKHADVEMGRENALALRILLATCVRSIELAKARREHIDLERGTWWVPDENVKTRAGFLVPLTPTVIKWMSELRGMAGDSAWLLPARSKRRITALGDTHIGNTTLWASITRAIKRGGIPVRRFTPHDTRSTAKGHMRNMGISKEVSEIALNHKLKGMEAIYDVREEIPERRHALELWAAFIESCESGREWNVVPINTAA